MGCRLCGLQCTKRVCGRRVVVELSVDNGETKEKREGGGRVFRGKGRRVRVRWQQRRRRGQWRREVTCFGLVRPNVSSRAAR